MARNEVLPSRLLVVATLTVRPGQLPAFEAYERAALAIAARYDGRVERTIRSIGTGSDETVEIHMLSFADRAGFDAWRQDRGLLDLAQVRDAAIARTEIVIGVAGPAYGD